MKITRWQQGATSSQSSGGQPSGNAGGDLGGGYPAPDVTGLRGTPICATTPSTGQVLAFNGSEWCPTSTAANLTVTDGVVSVTSVSTENVPLGGVQSAGAGTASLRYLTQVNGEQHITFTNTAAGSTEALDLSVANVFDLTLNTNCTLSFTNVPSTVGRALTITVILRQDATGSRTVTWPASVKWQDSSGGNTGSALTLWTAASAVNIIELSTVDGGTTWGAADANPLALSSPLTTKGDIWGYSTTNARVPVGSNGQLLTSDSTATTGVSWKSVGDIVPPAHAHENNNTFNGDGATTVFTLPFAPVDAYSIAVFIAGSRSQDWTLSGTLLDTLTFGSAPASGTDNIVVDIVAALA